MKKIVKIISGIILFIIILQVLIFFIKKSHDINYNIKNNDITFNVHEVLLEDNYYIGISTDGYNFSFKVADDYYKHKKIVNDIYYTLNENELCIYPKLEKDANINIVCSNKDKTYMYINSTNNLSSFINNLKDKKYNIKNQDNIKSKNIGKITYYDNIPLNTYIYIFKYNGFYSLSKNKANEIDVFKNDTYINDLGVLVDKYYLIPDYDQKIEFDKFYVYDLVKNSKKTINLKNKISRDSYINGVVDGKAYLFDKDKMIQYEINPVKKSIKIVGNKDDGGLYYDGSFKNISIYELKDKNITFKENYDHLDKIVDITSLKYIFKNNSLYYYQDALDDLYVYDSINNITTLLVHLGDISYIKNIGDDVYYIKEDTLYLYNINKGILKILSYNELKFNEKNRIAIYKK